MTTDTQLEPTDAEIDAIVYEQTGFDGDGTQPMTADEMRRVTRAVLARWGQPDGEHTNAELQQMLDECYEGKKKCYFALGQHQTAIDNLIKERDALIKSAHSGEPVARLEIGKTKGGASLTHIAEPAAFQLPEGMYALYTTPQPVEREPLTDEQIKGLIEEGVFFGNCKEIVRAIEAAHGIGIKGGKHGADT